MRAKARKAAQDKVAAFVIGLANEITALVGQHVDGVLSRAHAFAVSAIAGELGAVKPPPPSVKPPRKAPVRRAAKVAPAPEPVVHRDVKPDKPPTGTRGPYKCRKCGALGFRADGCGRTHNVGGAIATPVAGKTARAPKPVAPVREKPWKAALERTRAARARLDPEIVADAED